MSLIASPILSTFPVFARPMIYQRGVVSVTLKGHKRDARPEELIGDIDQVDAVVTVAVPDLQAAGLYPPLKHDRVQFVDGYAQSKTVVSVRYDYDGDQPVLVRLYVLG